MARRSTRIASSQSQPDSSPPKPQSSPASAGNKRKAAPGSSPVAKRGKKDAKEQKTIEESMDVDTNDAEQPKPEESKADEPAEEPKAEAAEKTEETANEEPETSTDKQDDPAKDDQANGHEEVQNSQATKDEQHTEAKEDAEQPTESKDAEAKEEPEDQQPSANNEVKDTANGDNAVEPNARDGDVPASILEKGIMYFLTRGRVGIDDPKNVQDIQRSFLILRPLPHGAKLSDGPIGDDKNCRLIAIPKKMLPLSGNDRWTAFVETSNVSFSELKESFMKSNDYTTQTGPRHTPAAAPVAEGVYAITTTGRESHLAYIITLPEELGDIQNDLGLRSQGSFVTSVKNPQAPGPANADIGKDPGYSQELMNDFRGLRWSALKPDHLNYEGCQFLMIGEGEQGLDKATEQQAGDEKKEETPMEEMQKLEGEDEIRVEHLDGEDAVFADLGTNAKDYPPLQSTW
ncbi:hypothetical protein PMZ80_010104 [Knufia obscura]|uniref:BTB domain transcription factor n=1 Tax=Knufia obscura TaxID=1635080 RepID=A0ABR0RA26_9EURO|nr:hypothetical protein PMZ80_010104 [Knufia obscura]